MFLIPDAVVRFYHRMASPPHFYTFTEQCMPWLVGVFVILVSAGLVGGLYLAPADVIIYLYCHGRCRCNWLGVAH
jgi:heme exporter protein C